MTHLVNNGYGSRVERLNQSRKTVAVVGAGGLGCPVSVSLVEAGVRLILIDADRVELSNLQRQTLFATTDLGRDKLEAAQDELNRRFPEVGEALNRIELRPGRLTWDTADVLLDGADLVIDATDDPDCRFIVNAWTLSRGLPAVIGGVHRFRGQVFAHAGYGPCFRCLFEESGPDIETCEQAGVIGALAGLVGHLQAERALELLRGDRQGVGIVTLIDALSGRTRNIALSRDPACPACRGAPPPTPAET